MRKNAENDILKAIADVNPDIEVLGRYSGINKPLEVRCKKCGYTWSPTPYSAIKGHGCPRCAGKCRKSHEEFVAELSKRNPEVTCLGTYSNAWKKILFRCNACGHQWVAAPRHILDGRSCPACARKKRGASQRLTMSELERRILDVDPHVHCGSDYNNNHSKLILRCDKCGHIWKQTYHNYMVSTGCPKCHRHGTSLAEQFMLAAFRKILGNEAVLSRDKSLIGMELDIFIPSLHFAVEPGAWTLHSISLTRAARKEQLCREKGVNLVTVFDHCDSAVEGPGNVITVKENLSKPDNYEKLKEVTRQLLEKAGLDSQDISESDFLQLQSEAYLNSRRMTGQEFKEVAEGANHKIIIIGDYKRSDEKIEYVCRKCGRNLYATPSSLLAGSGCIYCFGHPSKTDLEFRRELHEMNPMIEPIEEYKNTHTPIRFKCTKCNHVWKTAPYHLVAESNRTSCPKCGGKARKTTSSFSEELHEILPNITVTGEYISRKAPISVKCNVCGHEWSPLPANLLKGEGCPACYKMSRGLRLRKQVRCVETGIVYDSIRVAAQSNGVSSSAITNAAKGKTVSCAGFRWEYVTDNE